MCGLSIFSYAMTMTWTILIIFIIIKFNVEFFFAYMTEFFVRGMIFFLSAVAVSFFHGELFLLCAPSDLYKNLHRVFTYVEIVFTLFCCHMNNARIMNNHTLCIFLFSMWTIFKDHYHMCVFFQVEILYLHKQ